MKKNSLVAAIFFIATMALTFNQASASIILEIDESTMSNVVTFTQDMNGNTVPSYDVTFYEEVHYYQVGETFKISIKNEDTLADVYVMMTFAGDAASDNSWWLSQSMNLDTSPPTLQTSYAMAETTGNRKKFTQVGDQATTQIMEFYITEDMMNYPVTFWAFASDPNDGNIVVGMDAKTVFLAPDLSKTFLSAASLSELTVELEVNCIILNDVKQFHMSQNSQTIVTFNNVDGTFMITANSSPQYVMARLDTTDGFKVTLTANSAPSGHMSDNVSLGTAGYKSSGSTIRLIDMRSGGCNTDQRVTLSITLD